MMDRLEDWRDAEISVEAGLRPLLILFRPAFNLVDIILRTFAASFEKDSAGDDASKVQAILLTRLADDARCAWILAERGYALQVATIVSSALEIGFTAVNVGFTPENASIWLNWKDPLKTPWRVSDLVSSATKNKDTSGRLREGFKIWYMSLCWSKHANPVIQVGTGCTLSPSEHIVNLELSLGSRQASRISVALHVLLLVICHTVGSLIEADPGDRSADIWNYFKELGNSVTGIGRFLFPECLQDS